MAYENESSGKGQMSKTPEGSANTYSSDNPTSIAGCMDAETHPSSVDAGAVAPISEEADANDLGSMNPIPGADGTLSVDVLKKTGE